MYKGFSLDIVQYVAYIDQYPDRIVGRLVVIEFFFFFIFAEALSQVIVASFNVYNGSTNCGKQLAWRVQGTSIDSRREKCKFGVQNQNMIQEKLDGHDNTNAIIYANAIMCCVFVCFVFRRFVSTVKLFGVTRSCLDWVRTWRSGGHILFRERTLWIRGTR